MHKQLALVLGFLLFASCSSSEKKELRSPSSTDALKQDAQALITSIETNYAPMELKKDTVGLDWSATKKNFFNAVSESKSSGEVYKAIKTLLASLKDAHVSLTIPSDYRIGFGIQFMPIGKKILLNYIPMGARMYSLCPAQPGDELTAIEGKPIGDVLKSMEAMDIGNARSTRALQTYNLTNWTERNGLAELARPTKKGGMEAIFNFVERTSGTPFKCAFLGRTSGIPLVSFPINDKMTDAEAFAVARAEMQRILEVTRQRDIQVQKQTKKTLASLPISILAREKLEWVSKSIALQNRLVNLELGHIPESIDIAAKENEVTIKSGRPIVLGQERPYFDLPKNFKRMNGFGSGLPIVGKPFSRASGIFAGTFKRGDKTIGLIRIPSYMPANEIKLLFSGINARTLLSQLDRRTDLLIIDQNHNPGGAVVYSDWIVQALVGKIDPARHMKFAVRPRGDWLETYSSLVLSLKQVEDREKRAQQGLTTPPSGPDAYMKQQHLAEFQSNYEKVFAAHTRGEFLSTPISLWQTSAFMRDTIDSIFLRLDKNEKHRIAAKLVDVLYPFHSKDFFEREQAYTKPVYMLINELDFSGGDATPAVLQDYGRVKLVGVNTAGAGGSVEELKGSGTLDYQYRLTVSLMVRPGGKTVENTGVKPDVDFELTEEDVVNGFSGTFERLLKQLNL